MSISFGGIQSGLNTDQIISQLLQIEAQPQQRFQAEIEETEQKQQAFQDLNSRLETLNSKMDTLTSDSTFDQKAISNNKEDVLSASIVNQDKVKEGTFDVFVEQLATNASRSSGQVINDQKMVDLDKNNATLVSDFEMVEGSGSLDLTGTSSTDEMLDQFSKEIETAGAGNPEFEINGEQFDLNNFNTVQGLIDDINSRVADINFSYDENADKFTMVPTDQNSLGGTAIDTDDIQGNLSDGSKGFLQQIGINEDATQHSFADRQSDLGENLLSVDPSKQLQNNLFTTPLNTDGGEVEIRVNSTEIVLQDTDTVNDFISQVDDNVEGVNASFNDATDKVTLKTGDKGQSSIDVEDVRGNLADVLNLRDSGDESGGQSGADIDDGTDSEVTIDGDTVTGSGNKVTFNGIEMDLKELHQKNNNSDPVELEVSQDQESITNAVDDFVGQYNSIMEFINTRDNSNPASQPGEERGDSGVFAGDSTIRRVRDQMVSIVTSRFKDATGSESIQDLGSVGIEQNDPLVTSDKNKGKLNFSKSEFQSALDEDEQGVKDLFSADSDTGDPADGVATELKDYLENGVTDDLDGILPGRIDGLDRTISDLNDRIQENQERVQAKREQLEQRFLSMEQTLTTLNGQQQFISSRL